MLIALATTFFLSCNNGQIKTNRASTQTGTSAQLSLTNDSIYTCKMHGNVLSDRTGKCPECGMNLVKQKIKPAQQKLIKEGKYIQPKE